MKNFFTIKAFRILILTCGFFLFLSSAGCASSEGGDVQSNAAHAKKQILFPQNLEMYSEAQSWRNEEPDSLMAGVKNSATDGLRQSDVESYISEVSKIINENAENDFHKVKLINDIIAITLDYDMEAFLTHRIPPQNYSSVLYSGRAVCDGFASVFAKFCESTGVKCRTVHGYARGAGTLLENERPESLPTNHAWNIVTLGGRDFLVDVTWNEGHIFNGEAVKDYNTEWLFGYPEAFICTHFPSSEKDQLLDSPLSKSDFVSLPAFRPYFFDEIGFWSAPISSLVSCDGSLGCDFSKIKTGTKFLCAVKEIETNETLENAYFFKEGTDNLSRLLLAFPTAGKYRIQLFASDASNPEKNLYIGEFLVESSAGAPLKFPKIFSNYGSAKDGTVESPEPGPVKKGSSVFFSVRTNRSSVAVLIDDSEKKHTLWNYLEDKGDGLFEGNVDIPATAQRVRVNVKEDGGKNFWSLLEYELE